MLELLRVLFDDPAVWSTSFTSSLTGLLTVRERLALPGEAQRVRFTGGDATLGRVGALDWGKEAPGHQAAVPGKTPPPGPAPTGGPRRGTQALPGKHGGSPLGPPTPRSAK